MQPIDLQADRTYDEALTALLDECNLEAGYHLTLAGWLRHLRLERFLGGFLAAGITTVERLLVLDRDDLEACGVQSKVHRDRLMGHMDAARRRRLAMAEMEATLEGRDGGDAHSKSSLCPAPALKSRRSHTAGPSILRELK